MTLVLGRHIGKEICEALGIDAKRVRRVELIADCDNVVVLHVEQLVEVEHAQLLVALLSQYRVIDVTPRPLQPHRPEGSET